MVWVEHVLHLDIALWTEGGEGEIIPSAVEDGIHLQVFAGTNSFGPMHSEIPLVCVMLEGNPYSNGGLL